MSEEKEQGQSLGPILDAAKNVATTYKDEFKPAARQLGKLAETTGRAINLAISPVLGVIWGGEQIKEWVENKVAAKMEGTPTKEIVEPSASIVGPALEHIRFRASEPEIQDLFANLIATAMDRRLKQRIFPNFVEILKQLTPDEAKILKYMRTATNCPVVDIYRHTDKGRKLAYRRLTLVPRDAGCEFTFLGASYLDNLARLGLIEFLPNGSSYVEDGTYAEVESHPEHAALRDALNDPPNGLSGTFERSGFLLTSLGFDFVQACVKPYEMRAKEITDTTLEA